MSSTHWDDCWKSGPEHYECAAKVVEKLLQILLQVRYCYGEALERAEKAESEVGRLRESLQEMIVLVDGEESHLGLGDCYDGYYRGCWDIEGIVKKARAALDAARVVR